MPYKYITGISYSVSPGLTEVNHNHLQIPEIQKNLRSTLKLLRTAYLKS